MSIYEDKLDFDEIKKKYLGLILFGLILLILLFVLSQTIVNTKNPIEIMFEKNPVKANETSKVIVRIANNTDKDLENVPLRVFAKEKTEFDIFPLNSQFQGTISYLSKGTSREIVFVINPISKILPGSYVIVAETIIDDTKFTKEAILNVQ